jgi:putative NADH-flavin reductase
VTNLRDVGGFAADDHRRPMNLTIFGATGGVGTQLVTQALQRGHMVTAVVRDPARLSITSPALTVSAVPGLEQPDALRPAIQGRDAVLSAVGPRGRKDGPVASTSTRAILSAMQATGVRRLVAVSALPVGPVPEGESAFNRWLMLPVVSAVLRTVYADLAAMEAELRNSHTDWTVVRPPRLLDKPLTGTYRTALGANVPRAMTISRADVAHAMLDALEQPATIRQPVGLAY